MSVPIQFTPQHAQPFTLEQAMGLEIDMLLAEITRLRNSIEHLRHTQSELEEFMKEDPEGDDDGELTKAMKENENVIASQEERITLIKVALINKVGEGGMKHYGLEIESPKVDRQVQEVQGKTSSQDGVTNDDDGLHL